MDGQTAGLESLRFEITGDDSSGEAGLGPRKGEGRFAGLLRGAAGDRRGMSAANGDHSRRDGDVDIRREAVHAVADDREPASGIQEIGSWLADIRELQSFHRTLVGIREIAIVFE